MLSDLNPMISRFLYNSGYALANYWSKELGLFTFGFSPMRKMKAISRISTIVEKVLMNHATF